MVPWGVALLMVVYIIYMEVMQYLTITGIMPPIYMNLDVLHSQQVFRIYGAFDYGTGYGGLLCFRNGDTLENILSRYAT